jgi:hypothetical protein
MSEEFPNYPGDGEGKGKDKCECSEPPLYPWYHTGHSMLFASDNRGEAGMMGLMLLNPFCLFSPINPRPPKWILASPIKTSCQNYPTSFVERSEYQ